MKPEVFFKQLFEQLGVEIIDFSLEESNEEVVIKININEEAVGLIIGSKARGVDAIQHLARVIFGKQYDQKKIFVDVNDYRDQRKQKIDKMIESVADGVIKNQEPSMINQFLSPSERFYVHKTLSENEKYSALESYSVGEGAGRRVVIQPKTQKETT